MIDFEPLNIESWFDSPGLLNIVHDTVATVVGKSAMFAAATALAVSTTSFTAQNESVSAVTKMHVVSQAANQEESAFVGDAFEKIESRFAAIATRLKNREISFGSPELAALAIQASKTSLESATQSSNAWATQLIKSSRFVS